MARAHILGWPRCIAQREWEPALESFRRGAIDEAALHARARRLRRENWRRQLDAGLCWTTAGDFAHCDRLLSHAIALGAIPRRFGFDARRLSLRQHIELAHGNAAQPALRTASRFGAPHHYRVPELDGIERFDGGGDDFFDEIAQALADGHQVKPALIGPVSFLWLAGSDADRGDRLALLPALLDRYFLILRRVAELGATWIQLDEPVLCAEQDPRWIKAVENVYRMLPRAGLKILLATYCGSAAHHLREILALPVQGVHIDGVAAPQQLRQWLDWLPPDMLLSAGVVDIGAHADLRTLLSVLRPMHERLGDRLLLAPAAPLAGSALDSGPETHALAEQNPAEKTLQALTALTRALNENDAQPTAARHRSQPSTGAG